MNALDGGEEAIKEVLHEESLELRELFVAHPVAGVQCWLGGSSKHCPCSTSLSNLVCIISSRGIDTNEGTLDILKMVAQYSVYL